MVTDMRRVFVVLLLLMAAPWALATTYYVAPSGNDANKGTVSSPFRSIGKCSAVMAAGDTCEVAAGTYNEKISPGTSGVTYRARQGDKVVLDEAFANKCIGSNNKNDVTVEGFTCVRAFPIGVHLLSVGGWTIDSVVVDAPCPDNRAPCIGINLEDISAAGVTVRDSEVKDLRGPVGSADLNIHGSSPASTILITGGSLHDGNVDGVTGCGAGTIILDGVKIYNHTNVATHGDGTQFLGCAASTRLILRNNHLWDNTQDYYFDTYSAAPGAAPWGDILFYNNLAENRAFSGRTGSGFNNLITIDSRYNSINSFKAYNNTFAYGTSGNGCSIAGARKNYKIKDFAWKNNLLLNCTFLLDVDMASNFDRVDIDYNAYWADWTNMPFYGSRDFGEWKKYLRGIEGVSGWDEHSRWGNPKVADAMYPFSGRYDYRPSTAQAIVVGAGANLTSLGIPELNQDRVGNPRPADGPWDIGAYQYSGGR
jgi:hypothetical protein